MVMSRLNVEKNYKDTSVANSFVGQVNQNTDGAYRADVTPAITQGDGQGNRHGNSIKMTGASFPFQISGMSNCQGPRKLRISLLRAKFVDNVPSSTQAFSHYWDENPLTYMRDYNAPKNYRSGAHDGITCVRSQTYYLKAPSLLSGSDIDLEAGILTGKFNVKLNDVIRYDANGDALPNCFRYFIIVQADAGNVNASPSTLAVPITQAISGMKLTIGSRFWYVDN
jgi:hypothetical protein